MPPSLGFVERVPFPTLKNYVLMSFTSIGLSMLFAWSNAKDFMMESLNSSKNMTEDELDLLFDKLTFSEYNHCLLLALASQFWTICTMINTCYCALVLLGKVIQVAVFGDLRVSEIQQLKEKFWNFVFYKFIFVFGVLNVHYMHETCLWTAWYSLLCFFQLLAQLCRFRFEYLSCSPATPKSQHVKLVFLLTLIFLASICLAAGAIVVGLYTNWNVSGFLAAECLLLIIKTVYVIIKYIIYLVDLNHEGLWETRGVITYYTELICEIAALAIELLHYLHMVIWSNIFLSMASIVIWMQVRHLFNEIRKRITRHRSYLSIVKSMEERFTVATEDEIKQYDDNCAICWDKMSKARKLPCGHMFHNPCLRSWLAQDISCPTCRIGLGEQKPESPNQDSADGELPPPAAVRGAERAARPEPRRLNRTNHLFHFDASRYISWLPSFSVEVTHTQGQPRDNYQLDSMSNGASETDNEEEDSDDSYNSSMEHQGPDADSSHPRETTAMHELALNRALSNEPSNEPQLRQRLFTDQKVELQGKPPQQLRLPNSSSNQDSSADQKS
ncbi:E3 ubiquitin-protein ligase AMFR-like isoform X2 [Watersipora subatra]|uniref:E3 ubiquitin-protein ligase AMFR-like isoform X2 n=1 Tax=Watersipora subatra TaxID=2589382 RepID=UPI00355C0EC8